MAYRERNISYKSERWRGSHRGRYYDRGRGRGRGRGREHNRRGRGRGRGRGGFKNDAHFKRSSNAAWNMLDSYPGKAAFSFIKLRDDQILTLPVNNFGRERDPSYIYDCKANKWQESALKQHVESPIAMCMDRKSNHLYIYGRNKIEQKDLSELTPYGLYKVNMNNNSAEILTDTDLQDTIGTIVSLLFIDNKLHLFTDSCHAMHHLQGHKYKLVRNKFTNHYSGYTPQIVAPKQTNCHMIWNCDTKQFDIAHKFGDILKSGYTATYIEDKKMIVILSDPDIYELDLKTNKICKLELKMPRISNQQSQCGHIVALSDNQRFIIVYDKYFVSDELWVYNVEKRFFRKSGIKRTANGYPLIACNELHLIISALQPYYTVHECAQAYHEQQVASHALEANPVEESQARRQYEEEKANGTAKQKRAMDAFHQSQEYKTHQRLQTEFYDDWNKWKEKNNDNWQNQYRNNVHQGHTREYQKYERLNASKKEEIERAKQLYENSDVYQTYINIHNTEIHQKGPDRYRRYQGTLNALKSAKQLHTNHAQSMDAVVRTYEAILVGAAKSECNHFSMDITQIIPGYLAQNKREQRSENDKEKIQRLEEQIKKLRHELSKKETMNQQLRAENNRLRKQKALNPLNYLNWKYQDIVDWIINLNENKYARYRQTLMDNMKDEEIDGSCLVALTVDDLHRFGIRAFKDKQRILKEIKVLISKQKPRNENEGQNTIYI
eukprot:468750_1